MSLPVSDCTLDLYGNYKLLFKTKQKQSLYNPSNNLLLSMIFCELFPELQSSMFLFIMVKYILGTSYQGTNLINFSSITAPWFSSES